MSLDSTVSRIGRTHGPEPSVAEAPEACLLCAIRLLNTVSPWCRVTVKDPGNVTVLARGAAFLNDRWLSAKDLADCVADQAATFDADCRLDSLLSLVTKLNGSWALVVQWPNSETIAAVDRLRSISILYGRTATGGLVLADSAAELDACEGARALDDEAAVEFLLSGYIMGSRTLRKGVRQMQPGELLHWRDGDLRARRYYRFLRDGWSDAGQEELTRELDRVMHRVFARWVEAYKHEAVVVPLSGGLDSRLVLAMLKLHGHGNLTALNYGQNGDRESEISRNVANAIGVPWEFYPYEEGEWQPLMASATMRQFWLYSGQDAMQPHVQDFLALSKMRQKHPSSAAVFLPGTTGDMIAGAWVPDHFTGNNAPLDLDRVCEWLFYRKYREWQSHREDEVAIKARMRQFFAEAPLGSVHNSAAAFDLFEFEHRQSRYIVNSVRSFEFHSFRWGLPLCDNDLMEFYLRVPTELRELKRLFACWMRDCVFQGGLGALAEIPPAGDGRCVWYGERRAIRYPRFFATRERMRRLLRPLIAEPLKQRRWDRELREYEPHPLRFQEWFAKDTAESLRLRVSDLMGPDGLLADAPAAVADLVAEYAARPLCLGSNLGLFSAVYLADLNRRL